MYIIDAHTHIFPGKIAGKATDAIGDFYEMPMYAPGSPETLLESGAKIGTKRFLICSSATTPEQTYPINDFIAQQCSLHPAFFGLATMHHELPNIEEELDRAVALGLHGVKIHHDFQGVDIDEPASIPMYRAIAQKGLPLLFHMGDNRYDHTSPARLARVMRQVPELKVIAAHFGGYQAWHKVAKGLPLWDNLRFDTSSSLAILPKDDVLRLIDHFGVERYFFGTDFPMWEPVAELARFHALGLTEAEEEKIFHTNFEDFFGLERH